MKKVTIPFLLLLLSACSGADEPQFNSHFGKVGTFAGTWTVTLHVPKDSIHWFDSVVQISPCTTVVTRADEHLEGTITNDRTNFSLLMDLGNPSSLHDTVYRGWTRTEIHQPAQGAEAYFSVPPDSFVCQILFSNSAVSDAVKQYDTLVYINGGLK